MPLTSGTKIGPYEIGSLLGVGGMGEVYRSRDSKLGREVAVKVLPPALAGDPERLARFGREAKVLASLNHPNIAAIYGLEDSGSSHALVMELVEGPTLADRIKAGPIPVDEALPIAKQICEALEYAHERGIVHRDLKPANIKVTPEGTVKVLDFGLAKALENETAAADISSSPTMSRLATQAGMISGYGSVHVTGASTRQTGGSSRGHMGVWLCFLRNADGEDGVQRRDRFRHAGFDYQGSAGLDAVAFEHARESSRAGAALLAEGRAAAVAGHW